MTRLIHLRGDLSGMLLFFLAFFFGLWQVVVAWKRLNGLSLTGYPDRKWASYVIGVAIIICSGAWYFSGRGHFASPDLEGFETLLVMVVGLIGASVLQCFAAELAGLLRHLFGPKDEAPEVGKTDIAPLDVSIEVGGSVVPAHYRGAATEEAMVPVLLMHDYGGTHSDADHIADHLASIGHPTYSVDLDGHGANPREIEDPAMGELLDAASHDLMDRAVTDSFAAVGIGFGGLLAIGLSSSGAAVKAIALDPPARDEAGFQDVDALREFRIRSVLSAFWRPAAGAPGGKKISLSKLVAALPVADCSAEGRHAAIVGTRERWLNDPKALTAYSAQCTMFDPILLRGTHLTLPSDESSLEVISGVLE